MSVLVAVLVTFGVLTKHNEVTAFKASGVSLYRLTAPVLLASAILSAGLFVFDYYYVPPANRRQDALRDKIKGRAIQTYLRPERKWIKGAGSRIYYYKYFDTARNRHVRRQCVRNGSGDVPIEARDHGGTRAMAALAAQMDLPERLAARYPRIHPRKRPAFRGHDVSRAGRAARRFSEVSAAGLAVELPRPGSLYRRLVLPSFQQENWLSIYLSI